MFSENSRYNSGKILTRCRQREDRKIPRWLSTTRSRSTMRQKRNWTKRFWRTKKRGKISRDPWRYVHFFSELSEIKFLILLTSHNSIWKFNYFFVSLKRSLQTLRISSEISENILIVVDRQKGGWKRIERKRNSDQSEKRCRTPR